MDPNMRSDALTSLQQALLRKNDLESAMLAAPDDAAPRRAYFDYLIRFSAGRTGLLHAVLPELGHPVMFRTGTHDVVALARAKRDIQLVQALEHDVRLDRFEPGKIAISLVEGASPALAQTLVKRLQDWTGERWMVALVQGATAPTLREAATKREAERTSGAAAHPLVQKVLERFKGARIVEVRAPEAPPPPAAAPQSDEDVGYADSEPAVDDDL